MNGGEFSGSDAVNLVMRELNYQHTVKGSDNFIYDFNNRRVQQYLNYDEQAQILQTLDRRGVLSLRIERAESGVYDPFTGIEGQTPEIYIVNVEGIDWSSAESLVNENTQDTHLVRLNFRDGAMSLSVDGGEYKLIAKLYDGAKPYRIFEELFNRSPGVVIPNVDIFPLEGAKYNLKQVLTKSKLDYLLPFIDEGVLPKKIARKEDVSMTDKELQGLLSKVNENYRNNFSD